MENAVFKATNRTECAPKQKHLQYLIASTFIRGTPLSELFRLLSLRLRENSWVVVFKALIVVHFLIRQGDSERVLAGLAGALHTLNVAGFRDRSGTQGSEQTKNIHAYAMYLEEKVAVYRELKLDFTNDKSDTVSRLRKATEAEEWRLKEISILQREVDFILKCKFYLDEVNNEVTFTAYRLIVSDLLKLFHVENEGVMNLLEHYFEMTRTDARKSLDVYKTFCTQTAKVVEFLDSARRLQTLLGTTIPKMKHAPISLAVTLEDYLNSPDFEKNRMEYKANKSASTDASPKASHNADYADEDKELQKAIEESKRTAQEYEKKMMRASQKDLLSEKEKSGNDTHQRNLHGRQNSFDFFTSSPSNQQPQQQSFDPFESLDNSGNIGNSMNQQDLFGVGFTGGKNFGNGGGMNGFNSYPQRQQQQQQQQPFGGTNFNNNFNVGTFPPTNHATNPFGAAFGVTSVQTPPVNNFGYAFDGGMPAKQMPRELSNENATTRLASIPQNSAQNDPFANLASSRSVPEHYSNNPFGATTGSDSFGGVMAPTGQNPPLSAPATLPWGLPSGMRPNLVNLDALSSTNASNSPFANRNPFAASAGTSNSAGNIAGSGGASNKKYDWGGAGGSGGMGQRTLAELAATSSNFGAASPNMSGTRAGMGVPGGMSSTGMVGGAEMYGSMGTGIVGGTQQPSFQQTFFGQQQQPYQPANMATMYGQGRMGMGMGMGMAGSFNNGGPGAASGGARNASGNTFF